MPTKPEAVADDLIIHVSTAVNLAEVEQIGGRFQYPDGLNAVEWGTLRALKRGRDEAAKLKEKRDKKKKK